MRLLLEMSIWEKRGYIYIERERRERERERERESVRWRIALASSDFSAYVSRMYCLCRDFNTNKLLK